MKVMRNGFCRALTGSVSVPTQEEGLSILADVSLFKDYSAEQLRDMYPTLCPVIRRLEKGEILTLSSSEDNETAIVLYGTLKERRAENAGSLLPRSRFSPGSILTSESLRCISTGEVIAETACKLLFLNLDTAVLSI